MQLVSHSIRNGERIPGTNALGVPGDAGPVPGPNRSPHLAWSGEPPGTASFALLCHDRDAPTSAEDVNRPDRSVPWALPRADFFHWVLVDIPASVHQLEEGQDADGLVAGGKPPGGTPHGARGLNDYTGWFAGDAAMAGDYAGYDGPWPPFNDERVHHYVFTLHAVDVATLGLPARCTGQQVRDALAGHVLATATIEGTYALNPAAR